MDENVCDVECDVLLPPRKRLLAGFKKLNSDGDATAVTSAPSAVGVVASSSSSASLSTPPGSPTPSSVEFQTRLNHLLSSHLTKSQNMTPDQIVEASKSAAETAFKIAQAARTAAQEKATLAAMAVTAAKDALALVASLSEEGSAAFAGKDRNLKRNKTKKHVQVQLLYKKHQPVENFGEDDEMARKLHRVINSSPRISKNPADTDGRGQREKKHRNEDAGHGGNIPSMISNDEMASVSDSEDSVQEASTSKGDEKGLKLDRCSSSRIEIFNGETEQQNHCKDKVGVAMSSPSKKRGRLKLKKLPLSICNFRDQANPKEDTFPRGFPLTDKNMKNPTSAAHLKPLFPLEPSADNHSVRIEAPPLWKCQDFKAPTSVKQNKVMQS